jgi:hypothetical protein
MMGVAKFLVDKEAILHLEFDDPREVFLIKGKFIRSETVEGRKELVSLVVLFNESSVPMGYKIRINDFISQVRPETKKKEKGGDFSNPRQAPMKAAAAKPAQSPQKPALKKDDWPSPEEAAATAAPATASASTPSPAAKTDDDDFDLDLPS